VKNTYNLKLKHRGLKGLFMQQPHIPCAPKIQTATDIPQI